MGKIKVKLLVSRAGPGLSQHVGDEIEVDAAEAKRMLEAGQIAPVDDAPVEKAARRRGKG